MHLGQSTYILLVMEIHPEHVKVNMRKTWWRWLKQSCDLLRWLSFWMFRWLKRWLGWTSQASARFASYNPWGGEWFELIWQHLASYNLPPLQTAIQVSLLLWGNACFSWQLSEAMNAQIVENKQAQTCTCGIVHPQWSRDRSICSAQCGVQDSEGWVFTLSLNQHFLQAQVHPKCDSWRSIPNKQIPWTLASSLYWLNILW